MSIDDLHEIVAQLHKFAEEGGTHRAPTLQETHLLFKTALRAVDELASLERRVAALEGKQPSPGGDRAVEAAKKGRDRVKARAAKR